MRQSARHRGRSLEPGTHRCSGAEYDGFADVPEVGFPDAGAWLDANNKNADDVLEYVSEVTDSGTDVGGSGVDGARGPDPNPDDWISDADGEVGQHDGAGGGASGELCQ